jgi:hypothetical protein
MKDKKVFYITEAIEEITDILIDKTSLKNIKVQTHYRGFDGDFQVKTDMKRL